MEKAGCLIEQLSDEVQISGAMSIKRSSGLDEIVFNPVSALTLLRAFSEMGYGLSYPFDPDDPNDVIRGCCSSCDNCTPYITSDYPDLRIKRKGFSYTESRPAFEIKGRYEGKNTTKTVVIVDDDESIDTLAMGLAGFGLTVVAVQVHRNAEANLITQRALAALVEAQHPDCVVSDKGLGYLSGIELIEYLKEVGIFTFMLTGERQTDETRRVADYFLEKPMRISDLARTIKNSLH